MKFNSKEMVGVGEKQGQIEGRLQYRQPPATFRETGFRERYFKLVNNLLFYYRVNEIGQIDLKEPVGLIVLENYSVRIETESELPFAFGILFLDEPDRRHVFTGRSDEDVNRWVNMLRKASYEHWKNRLNAMKSNIAALKEARQSIKVDKSNPKGLSSSFNDLSLVDFNDKPSPSKQRRNPFLPPPIPERPSVFPPSLKTSVPVVHVSGRPPPQPGTKSSNVGKANNNNAGEDLIKF